MEGRPRPPCYVVCFQSATITRVPDDVAIGDDTMMAVDQMQAALPGSCAEVIATHLALLHTNARVQAAHHAVRCWRDLSCRVQSVGWVFDFYCNAESVSTGLMRTICCHIVWSSNLGVNIWTLLICHRDCWNALIAWDNTTIRNRSAN